jgi:hypothetical protein
MMITVGLVAAIVGAVIVGLAATTAVPAVTMTTAGLAMIMTTIKSCAVLKNRGCV